MLLLAIKDERKLVSISNINESSEKQHYDEIRALYVQLRNGNHEATPAFEDNSPLEGAFLQLLYFSEPTIGLWKAKAKARRSSTQLIDICSAEEHDSFPYSLYVYAINLDVTIGVEEDEQRAFELMTKAASYDYPPALLVSLACYYRIGEQASQDNDKVLNLIKPTALMDYVPALDASVVILTRVSAQQRILLLLYITCRFPIVVTSIQRVTLAIFTCVAMVSLKMKGEVSDCIR